MDLVVYPSSGLLYSERSPLMLCEESAPLHSFVDVLGKKNVPVLEVVVLVLLGVFGLFWKVRHFKFQKNIYSFS